MTPSAFWAITGRTSRVSGPQLAACAAVVFVGACSDDAAVGAGAAFSVCIGSSDCTAGLSCECGFCTRVCEADSECSEVRTGSSCAASSGDPACEGTTAAASVCVVECSESGECGTGEACVSRRCRGSASPTDGGMDGGVSPDGSTPDGTVGDAGPVECSPHTWFCNRSGTGARYCNAAGDGVVRDVDCGGRACVDGLCEPLLGVNFFCGALKNGVREERTGGVACEGDWPGGSDWSYLIWLDRGDRLVADAEALSPLVDAEITIDHPCETNPLERCETTERSGPGDSVAVERVALHPEAIRVRMALRRDSGGADGARLQYDLVVHPADPVPPLPPPVCTPGQRTCTGPYSLTYCSPEGQFEAEHSCWIDPLAHEENPCAGGECAMPRGESCADAMPIERPPNDQLNVDADLDRANNDFDPGIGGCLDLGMTGVDRVFRLDMTAGERVRVSHGRGSNTDSGPNELFAVYLLGDCADPAGSCLAKGQGYRQVSGGGGSGLGNEMVVPLHRPAEFTYVAPEDQTVFMVVDTEWGAPRSNAYEYSRYLRISWDGTCIDRVQNGDETGVDCGGPCGPCGDGDACTTNDDCESRRCEGSPRRCTRPAGCQDGVFSLGEQCDDGNSIDDDWCSNACLVPSCDDGVRNGDEVAPDEGGYCEATPRDVCRRAEVIPVEFDFNYGMTRYVTRQLDRDVSGASDAFAPGCGQNGIDHACRLEIQERSRVAMSVISAALDPLPYTLSLLEGCGEAVVECATGNPMAGFDRILDPGDYIVWVDVPEAATEPRYALFFEGELEVEP